MQKQHTVLCIQDLSCVGRCSLAVVLPALAAMGVQPCALPTALLSTHTGGLGRPARTDESGFISAALHTMRSWALHLTVYTAAILPAPHRWRWWNRPSARLRRR